MPLILKNTSTATVVTPGTDKNTLFFDNDILYSKDDAGVIHTFGPGTVSSVDVSGGTTGLTTTGGPITTTGTITITGTLNTLSGGTGITSYAPGDILYAPTTNTLATLGTGSAGQVLTIVNGLPAWSDDGASQITFDYGDASPKNLVIVAANTVITSVSIIILTPFTDVAATLAIGDAGDPNRLLATTDNAPSVAGTYTVDPAYKYTGSTQLILTINPGTSSAGNGIILLNYQ